MTKVLLDIGAGGSTFARVFRKSNAQYDLAFLCGDIRFREVWNGECVRNNVQRIYACYENFVVPDKSVDIVTLNAYSPVSFSFRLIAELERVLRPGGIFFSAHPAGLHPHLSKDIFSLLKTKTQYDPEVVDVPFQQRKMMWEWGATAYLLNGSEVTYPASPAIRDRMVQLRIAELCAYKKRDTSVLQTFEAEPTLRMWARK